MSSFTDKYGSNPLTAAAALGSEILGVDIDAETTGGMLLSELAGYCGADERTFTVGPGGRYTTLKDAITAVGNSTFTDDSGNPGVPFASCRAAFHVDSTIVDLSMLATNLSSRVGEVIAIGLADDSAPLLAKVTNNYEVELEHPYYEDTLGTEVLLYIVNPAHIFLMPGYRETVTTTMALFLSFTTISAIPGTAVLTIDNPAALTGSPSNAGGGFHMLNNFISPDTGHRSSNELRFYGVTFHYLAVSNSAGHSLFILPTGVHELMTSLHFDTCTFRFEAQCFISGEDLSYGTTAGTGKGVSTSLYITDCTFIPVNSGLQVVGIGMARELVVTGNTVESSTGQNSWRFIRLGIKDYTLATLPSNDPQERYYVADNKALIASSSQSFQLINFNNAMTNNANVIAERNRVYSVPAGASFAQLATASPEQTAQGVPQILFKDNIIDTAATNAIACTESTWTIYVDNNRDLAGSVVRNYSGIPFVRVTGDELTREENLAAPSISASLSLAYSAISGASSALPTNSGSVRIHAHDDCFIEFGDSSVTADGTKSIYMAGGTEVFGLPSGATHIAVKGAGSPGAIQVTGLDSTYKYTLTTNAVCPVQGGSSNVALPSGRMVRLFSMTDCYINFGGSTVTSDESSMFFEAGTEVLRVPSGATYIAAVRYALNGGLYISGVN